MLSNVVYWLEVAKPEHATKSRILVGGTIQKRFVDKSNMFQKVISWLEGCDTREFIDKSTMLPKVISWLDLSYSSTTDAHGI